MPALDSDGGVIIRARLSTRPAWNEDKLLPFIGTASAIRQFKPKSTRSPSPPSTAQQVVYKMKRFALSSLIIAIFIIGHLPRPAWAATDLARSERLVDRIALGGNNCRTECDCYKNSALFGTDDTSHLCFECSRERNGTCQVIATCPRNYICTTDPTYGSSLEFTCVAPRDTVIQPECFTDADCVRSFQNPMTLEVRTFNGYCLPNANCRFPKYGVLAGAVVGLELSLRPFNHLTCSPPRQNLACRSLADCYYHGANSPGVLQDANVTCSEGAGVCVSETLKTLVLLADKSAPQPQQQHPQPLPAAKTERERLLQRLNAPATVATTGTAQRPALIIPTTEPATLCNTGSDCVHLSRTKDLDGFASCYSCLPTFGPVTTPAQFLRNNVTKQCVRTDSKCASGMCHHGQCVGKACTSHKDCLDIAGIARHCHQCDSALGICRERHLCPEGQFCTADVINQRYCSALVQECDGNNLSANLKRGITCVPTGTDGLGYQRLTNYLLGAAPLSNTATRDFTYQTHALLAVSEERQRLEREAAEELARRNQTATTTSTANSREAVDWSRTGTIRLDSIAFDQMPENINQHLMSRGSNGQTRIVQYTPAQQARRTRASFEKGDEPPVADTITTQATNDTQPSGGDENADPKENHTGDVLGDDVSTTADTGTTMAILPASKKSTATTTTATTTATNSNSNPDAGQPPQAIMIVTLVAVLLLIVLVAATWFIIPKVSRIYIRHDKSPFGLAAEAAHTPPPPRASAGNNNIVVHPSTATLTQRIVPARTNITYGI